MKKTTIKIKKQVITKYISKHPKYSGNKTYLHFKDTKYGIRKQNFYKLYRKVKHIKPKSVQYRKRFIPTKYKEKIPIHIPKVELPKKRLYKPQEDYYRIDKYQDKLTKDEYFLVYQNKEQLLKQLNKLSSYYQINLKNLKYVSGKVHRYKTEFIDTEFKKEMIKNGFLDENED